MVYLFIEGCKFVLILPWSAFANVIVHKCRTLANISLSQTIDHLWSTIKQPDYCVNKYFGHIIHWSLEIRSVQC